MCDGSKGGGHPKPSLARIIKALPQPSLSLRYRDLVPSIRVVEWYHLKKENEEKEEVEEEEEEEEKERRRRKRRRRKALPYIT